MFTIPLNPLCLLFIACWTSIFNYKSLVRFDELTLHRHMAIEISCTSKAKYGNCSNCENNRKAFGKRTTNRHCHAIVSMNVLPHYRFTGLIHIFIQSFCCADIWNMNNFAVLSKSSMYQLFIGIVRATKKNSCLGFLTVQQVDCCKKGGIFSQKSCEKLFSRNVKRIRECQADLGQTSVKTKDWIINYFCGEKKAKVWRLNIVIDYNRAMRWTRTINTNHQSKVSKLVDLMSMWKKRGKRARKRLNDVSLPYSHDKWPFSDITVGSSYVIQVTTESSRTNARSKLIASHWKINKN